IKTPAHRLTPASHLPLTLTGRLAVTISFQRLRQLENRQFHTWIEFQRLWNEVNLILWRAKTHHRNIRQAIDVYGRDMRSVLRDVEGLVSSGKSRGNPVGFAPDQVLNYQGSAVAGESGMPSSAAAKNVKSGPNSIVKGHHNENGQQKLMNWCDMVQNKPLGSKKCSALKEIRPQVALSSRSKQVPASTP
ncbi:hypothetical protein COOONC_25427, partial [Cooperia oncophora]